MSGPLVLGVIAYVTAALPNQEGWLLESFLPPAKAAARAAKREP